MSGSSIAPGITPAPISTDARSIVAVIFRVPCISTSITSPTSRTRFRTCCPARADFAKKVGLLGIGDGDRVVVYDRLYGGAAAARVWWMFRVFGYDKVAMLDGGYGKWTKEKQPTDMSTVRPEPRSFSATYNPALVRSLREMKENLATAAAQVVDARGPAKFDGTQEDVFPFKKLGHIPNATNIPWADLIDPDTGAFIAADTARRTICHGRDRSANVRS